MASSGGAVAGAGGLQEEKSRMVAALLAFFLGCLGAHKFYTGHTTAGIIYIIAIFTGVGVLITAVLSLIEAIFYITCKNDTVFTQKYCVNS